MIESFLKKKAGTFSYATVTAVNAVLQKVRVKSGSELQMWIPTSLALRVGDTVIVARNDKDASRLIIQHSRKAVPSHGTLLLI